MSKAPPDRRGATTAWVALLAFVAAYYAAPADAVPALARLPIAQAAAFAAVLALAVAVVLADRRLVWGGGVGAAAGLFFAVLAASAAWSLWPRRSAETAVEGLKFGLVFWLVANLVHDRTRLRAALAAIGLLSLVPAAGASINWTRGVGLVEGTRAAWVGNFANPNLLAYHLVVAIPLLLAVRGTARSAAGRLALGGAAALLVAALLLTGSRGGLFGLGGVVLMWVVSGLGRPAGGFAPVAGSPPTGTAAAAPAPRRAAAVPLPASARITTGRGAGSGAVALALGVLVAVYATPGVVWHRAGSTLTETGLDASAAGRIDAWWTGWAIAEARPLTGVGAGAFVVAWPLYAPGDAGPPRTAHNSFVQVLAELGLLGLAPFVAAVGLALARAARRARAPGPDGELARGVAVGLWGFVVCSATGGYALSWPLWLLLGVAASPALRGAPVVRGLAAPGPAAAAGRA